MKRCKDLLILGAGFLLPFLFPACLQLVYNSEFRVITGSVINDVLIETDDGNLWFYESDIPKGTWLQVGFDTKGTKDVIDDEIIFIKELR